MQQITYLFRCENGHYFEVKSETPLQTSVCPVCGSEGSRVYEINIKKHGVVK